MLEKIMDLHILLYSMAAIGAVGAIGMLATNLTYRRLLKSTGSRKAGSKNGGITGKVNLKEKWLNLWKTRDRLLHRMNRLVWYPALISIALLGLAVIFHSSEAGGGIAPYVSVCGSHASGGAFAFAPGTGLFLQRRTGDKHPCRLCGADAHLGRGNSGRKEDRSGSPGRGDRPDHKQH